MSHVANGIRTAHIVIHEESWQPCAALLVVRACQQGRCLGESVGPGRICAKPETWLCRAPAQVPAGAAHPGRTAASGATHRCQVAAGPPDLSNQLLSREPVMPCVVKSSAGLLSTGSEEVRNRGY